MKQATIRAPNPATDHSSALAQFEALAALDEADVNPDCRSQLLTHGQATERAIVLVHGMTNCPRQYRLLAPLFFEQGYNVLIPRMPGNGLLDRDTTVLGSLTPKQLQDFGGAITDIAQGLGGQVTVVGISAGATITAWLAQIRGDIKAVCIAPFLGLLPELPVFINSSANVAVTSVLGIAPNIMTQRFKPFVGGPPQSYRGFASRGLAAVMQVGRQVERAARVTPPKAQAILMMLNPVDPAVNNGMSFTLLKRWQAHGAPATLYTFDPARKLIHDVIDPEQVAQQTDYTYPILLERITSL